MTTAKRDYYEVLGVPRTASTEEIMTFCKLAMQHQPARSCEPSVDECAGPAEEGTVEGEFREV